MSETKSENEKGSESASKSEGASESETKDENERKIIWNEGAIVNTQKMKGKKKKERRYGRKIFVWTCT